MDVFDCIRTRRSVHKYKDKAVPWDNVVEILQAGKYAPCAGNIFNLKFIVIKDESKRKTIAESSSQQFWMQDAPIHIVIVSDPEKIERYYGTRGIRFYTLQTAGAVVENMMLAATALGLGSCWVGAFDERELKRMLSLPEQITVQGIVTIGYAEEHPPMPPKNRIEHVAYIERWYGRIGAPKTGIGMWSPVIKHHAAEAKKHVKKKAKGFIHKLRERIGKKK